MSTCGHELALVAGGELPAMSISWEPPIAPIDSGYIIFLFDYDLDSDEPEGVPICLHCLTQDGDQQLGRGLDLARMFGRVDYLLANEEDPAGWFVPDDPRWDNR